MAFNSFISRGDAQALIPEDVTAEILQNAPTNSAVMQLARRLPNMPTNQTRMSILAALATAYFVNGDTGKKKTTSMRWENKFIDAEELAVIIPIPINVLDDTSYDIWGECRPRIEEAFGVAFDEAVFYSTNAPANWPAGIVDGATAAGHAVTRGALGDLYDDLLGENGVASLVEEDGFLITGHVGALGMRSALRSLRSADGFPLFNRTVQEGTQYELDGNNIVFPRNGAIDAAQSLLITGDWDQLVWSIRKDITYEMFREGVIQDENGNITLNLMQQDMVALRATFRLGWQLPNPINRINPTEATRYPFAVLTP